MGTRRLFMAFIGFMLMMTAWAVDKNLEKGVSTVVYELAWTDLDAGLENPVHDYGNDYRNDELMITFGIVGLVILCINIGLFILIWKMAKKRNRSAGLWVVLGLFLTPLIPIIILLCIGHKD